MLSIKKVLFVDFNSLFLQELQASTIWTAVFVSDST